jgi:zinc transport system substrate-binding protein
MIHRLRRETTGASALKKLLFSGLLTVFLFNAQLLWARPLKVFVSILPQKYFVEKIGGDQVEIGVMVQPGANPAVYEPKPQQMVALAETQVYFAIGVPFEAKWLEKIAATHREMKIVHTEAGIERIAIQSHHQHALESKLRGGEKESRHRHSVIQDPHVWLSPPLVMLQARNILAGLLAVAGTHRSLFEANYRKFIMEIVDLDLELKQIFAVVEDRTEFMVFHPSWGYFASTYGLKQVPIELQGKEPKPGELQRLIQYGKERGIRVVFVQPQFSPKAAQTIAESLGGQIALADPLAHDWAENLRQVATKLRTALR